MTDDVVTKAAAFAKAAHESIDQRRKFTNEPYIVHPQAVAQTVETVTDDAATLAAAWLHDVVEDTAVSIQEIESEFGEDIAALVADLTDVSQPCDGNRKQRKAIDRHHTADSDPRAKTVKLADVINNLSDIVRQDPGFAVKYLEEKELLLQVLSEGHPELLARAQQVVAEAKQALAKPKP